MIKFLFVKPDNLVSHIVSPGIPNMYTNKTVYGNCLAVRINSDIPDTEILQTWHWAGTAFRKHERNTNPVFIWDETTCTYKEPDNYLEIVTKEKLSDLSKMYNSLIYADITFDGSVWQAGARDRLALQLKYIEAGNGSIALEDLFWRDKANIDHYFSTNAGYMSWLTGILAAISARSTALHKIHQKKKAEITALLTPAEVMRYDVLVGWDLLP